AHPPHPRTAGLRRPRSIAVHGPLGRVGPHGVDGHVDLGGLLRLVVEVDLHLVAVFALDDLVLDVVRLVVVDRRHLVAQLLERRAVVRLVLADAEVLLELVAVGARGLQARAVADALGVARLRGGVRVLVVAVLQRLVGGIGLPDVGRDVDLGRLAGVLVEVHLHFVRVLALDDLVLEVVGLVVVDRRDAEAHLLERLAVVRLVLADAERLLHLVLVGRPVPLPVAIAEAARIVTGRGAGGRDGRDASALFAARRRFLGRVGGHAHGRHGEGAGNNGHRKGSSNHGWYSWVR